MTEKRDDSMVVSKTEFFRLYKILRPFVRAENKETAIFVIISFILENGYNSNADPDELFDIAIRVATKAMNRQQLEIWLERNCIRV
ncbi:hypothetical protein [Paenibacillus tyrfis]|uniref:hypothetical protein n=1 Tax=Paenibacillus tyrfis TaxID=1501230 RepID=UPI000B58B79C|nr:hypothetical protein [Paenibacillus tyrfis]